jgi:hypothetical protein
MSYTNVRYPSYTDPNNSRGSQLFTSIILIVITGVAMFGGELVYNMATDKSLRIQNLLDMTVNAEDNIPPIHQDPIQHKDAITIMRSVNERSGIEFAYSFFINVNPSTFTGEDVLKHVFHKGFMSPWPLMGPGVFIRGNSNTMRIFMNTHANPYSFIDIKNIPVQKWFHVVLNCYSGGLDVYINGNLANRLLFKNTVPYQNFQNIHFFSKAYFNNFSNPRILALPEGATMNISGSFQGSFASLKYARYSLSTFEIERLLSQGPSSTQRKTPQQLPPYLSDTWWSNQNLGN